MVYAPVEATSLCYVKYDGRKTGFICELQANPQSLCIIVMSVIGGAHCYHGNAYHNCKNLVGYDWMVLRDIMFATE